jgi:hypothetical protein
MKRDSTLVWLLAGLVSALVGWAVGGLLFGSLMGRTVAAATLVAAASGALMRGWRLAAVVAPIAVALGAGAFVVGARTVTPLIAWPATALLIGVTMALTLDRTGPRVAAIVAAPVLGVAGFGLGATLVLVAGFGADAPRVLEQLLAGGAALFGLATFGGLRLLCRLFGRQPSTAGGAR